MLHFDDDKEEEFEEERNIAIAPMLVQRVGAIHALAVDEERQVMMNAASDLMILDGWMMSRK